MVVVLCVVYHYDYRPIIIIVSDAAHPRLDHIVSCDYTLILFYISAGAVYYIELGELL